MEDKCVLSEKDKAAGGAGRDALSEEAKLVGGGDRYVPSEKVKKYFAVLEPEFPEWLWEYINTPRLLNQRYISVTCGIVYTDLLEGAEFYSSLDHSVGVALIVWHFTHDRKQTLAGLFHDIATPAFKHCLDILNGDYMKQESTEELTSTFIKESPEIMRLLKRDKIKVEEVDDYHIYPIADNETPQLSADRLEYSLAHALFTFKLKKLSDVKRMYNDITVLSYKGVPELGFKTAKVAREFVALVNEQSVYYRDNRVRYSMQLIADIVGRMNELGMITIEDLYKLSDEEVMARISQSPYGEALRKWREAKELHGDEAEPEGVYNVHCAMKVRYIDPLCEGDDGAGGDARREFKRMSESDEVSRGLIEKNLAYAMNDYIWIDGVKLD